ncbi:MAG: response regulator transcription factor [Chitinophagaceae bacterium]|nr:MAG: response regulator transcription factor [Chitinophagaceae bacterium]
MASTTPLRCLIVDDEPLARQLLAAHVAQVEGLALAGNCATAMEAFAFLHRDPVDLLFLDINMPGIDGVSFLRSLKAPPKVIFTTAYAEHAVDAFELDAVDYLLKPVTFERFFKAVQKLLREPLAPAAPATPARGEEAIFLKVNKRLLRVPFASIRYVEGLGDYVKVYTDSGVHVSYLTLGKAEELLPAGRFMRVHKSWMIHIDRIEHVEGNSVRVAGQDVPVGATYRDALLAKLGGH